MLPHEATWWYTSAMFQSGDLHRNNEANSLVKINHRWEATCVADISAYSRFPVQSITVNKA